MMAAISGNVFAADLVSVLHKTFRDFNYPHEEKVVGLEVITRLEHQEGDGRRAEQGKTIQLHNFLVNELGRRGWRENRLAIDDVQAKPMELILGYRTKVFVNQCEFPGNEYPYQGEDYRVFFKTPIEKMEECMTYELQLQ
jgi:hypothetical protein